MEDQLTNLKAQLEEERQVAEEERQLASQVTKTLRSVSPKASKITEIVVRRFKALTPSKQSLNKVNPESKNS
jgi:hypothetical protein